MFLENKNHLSDEITRSKALNPTESFLIQAPAGSGKTELLTDRIIVLLDKISQPEEILAITFTKKSASEMRSRVIEKLQLASNGVSSRAKEYKTCLSSKKILKAKNQKNWGLLENIDRLNICTIDSFFVSLARKMSFLPEFIEFPKIVENDWSHYIRAAKKTLDLAQDQKNEDIKLFLSCMDINISSATQYIADMLSKRDQWLRFLSDDWNQNAAEKALREMVENDLIRLFDSMPFGWMEILPEIARQAAQTLEKTVGTKHNHLSAFLDWHTPFSANEDSLNKCKTLSNFLLTRLGKLRAPVSFNKTLGFLKNCSNKEKLLQWLEKFQSNPDWIMELKRIRDVPNPKIDGNQWKILTAQLKTLMLASKQLKKNFLEAGEVDLIEVIHRVSSGLENLENPTKSLERKGISISHLLVDEFQDTNQVQENLIKRLTHDWNLNSRKTLFLVGDPMQSIYRFRKAEVGLFLQIAEKGIGNIRPNFLKLTNNFRSNSGIVEWINNVFSCIFPQRNIATLGAIKYEKSISFCKNFQNSSSKSVYFHPTIVKSSNNSNSSIKNACSEDAAVQLIQNILKENKNSKVSIGLLVRARSHLGDLVERLTLEGIPYIAHEIIPMKKSPVISDLIQLLRAILNHADRLAWLSLLRSPLCGLTLDTMHTLFSCNHIAPIPILLQQAFDKNGIEFSLEEEFPKKKDLFSSDLIRAKYLYDVLMDKSNTSGIIPIAEWIQFLWKQLGGEELYPKDNSEQDSEDFFQMLEENVIQYGELDLTRLEKEINLKFLSRNKISESDVSYVEIMTIHKAKGLQFETVILYGLHHLPKPNQKPKINFEQSKNNIVFGPIKSPPNFEEDPISHYLAQREHMRDSYESDRLLYVASTRACKKLHLIGNIAFHNEKFLPPAHGSFLRKLWPYLKSFDKNTVFENSKIINKDIVSGDLLSRVQIQQLPVLFQNLKKRFYHQNLENLKSGSLKLRNNSEILVNEVFGKWISHLKHNFSNSFFNISLFLDKSSRIVHHQLFSLGIPRNKFFRSKKIILESLKSLFDSHESSRSALLKLKNSQKWPLAFPNKAIFVLKSNSGSEVLVFSLKTDKAKKGETLENFVLRMNQKYERYFFQYYWQLITFTKCKKIKSRLYFPRNYTWVDL